MLSEREQAALRRACGEDVPAAVLTNVARYKVMFSRLDINELSPETVVLLALLGGMGDFSPASIVEHDDSLIPPLEPTGDGRSVDLAQL